MFNLDQCWNLTIYFFVSAALIPTFLGKHNCKYSNFQVEKQRYGVSHSLNARLLEIALFTIFLTKNLKLWFSVKRWEQVESCSRTQWKLWCNNRSCAVPNLPWPCYAGFPQDSPGKLGHFILRDPAQKKCFLKFFKSK